MYKNHAFFLQGRLFSYVDTHRHRLGTNYQQIPVNCPYRSRLAYYQRDGPQCVDDNQGKCETLPPPSGSFLVTLPSPLASLSYPLPSLPNPQQIPVNYPYRSRLAYYQRDGPQCVDDI